ncbi:MAG: hypothetical protein AAFV86_07455 [Pseudomonadota bacterium]
MAEIPIPAALAHLATPAGTAAASAATGLDEALLLDLMRLVHLAAIAAGIGVVIATDFTMLRLLGLPIGARQGHAIEAAHGILVPALATAWVSGIALLAWRTGLDPAALTPKILAKLAVVTMLTANAVLIHRAVRPTLALYAGARLVDLPYGRKLVLAAAGAFSVAGWTAALILGGSAVMRTAGWDLLLPLIGGLYLSLLAAGLTTATVGHLRRPREPEPRWIAAE